MSKKKRKFRFTKSSLQVRSTAELEKEVNEILMLNVPDPPAASGVMSNIMHLQDKDKNENPKRTQ